MPAHTVRFCPWFPLAEISHPEDLERDEVRLVIPAGSLPDCSVVLQARSPELNTYPGGRSAMLRYDAGLLWSVVSSLKVALPTDSLIRVRHHPSPEGERDRLLRRFSRRFSALPVRQSI